MNSLAKTENKQNYIEITAKLPRRIRLTRSLIIWSFFIRTIAYFSFAFPWIYCLIGAPWQGKTDESFIAALFVSLSLIFSLYGLFVINARTIQIIAPNLKHTKKVLVFILLIAFPLTEICFITRKLRGTESVCSFIQYCDPYYIDFWDDLEPSLFYSIEWFLNGYDSIPQFFVMSERYMSHLARRIEQRGCTTHTSGKQLVVNFNGNLYTISFYFEYFAIESVIVQGNIELPSNWEYCTAIDKSGIKVEYEHRFTSSEEKDLDMYARLITQPIRQLEDARHAKLR